MKRYDSDMDAPHGMERNDKQGYWVEFSDYQSLQAALREALEAWGWWIGAREGATPKPDFAIKRIAALYVQFLDDK